MSFKQTVVELLKPIKRRYKCSKKLNTLATAYSQKKFPALVVFDVGARWGISKPYDKLKIFSDLFSVGFEPDIEEANRLETLGVFSKTVPVGLGSQNEDRTLYVAQDPGCSSLFKPNMTEIARHTGSKQFRTVKEITISLVTLENACKEHNIPDPDFIKVDCEGAEEIIFTGAGSILDRVIGVSFEARLVEFYKGEPNLQRLLDFFLERGFVLLDITSVGSFNGEKVMFDVAMIRHPEQYKTNRDYMIGKIFSLIFDNFAFCQKIEDAQKAYGIR